MNAPNPNMAPDADLIVYPEAATAGEPQVGRAQNFSVEWINHAQPRTAESPHELLLLLPGAGARIEHGSSTTEAPGRSLCIIPAGRCTITLHEPALGILIASTRNDLRASDYLNARAHDPRIVPSTPAFRLRAGARGVRVVSIDDVSAPPDNPRLKMFQTDTLSINWVEYDGPRDRTKLSPHSHADFEQGSLAIEGHFIHHLRTPWGTNANLWRDDEHRPAPPHSLLVIPPGLIHTTEGVGAGYHLLIDIFSPPRRDFIAKGWVSNSADYEDPSRPAP